MTNTKGLHIDVSPEIYAELDRLAKDGDVSINDMLRTAIGLYRELWDNGGGRVEVVQGKRSTMKVIRYV